MSHNIFQDPIYQTSMRGVNSANNAKSDEDPSAKQVESSAISRDGEESKTLTKDLIETKEEEKEKEIEEGEGEEKEKEESGECLLYEHIKGGECKDAFIELEKCVDEAVKNKESDLKKCKEIRLMLKTCMYDNPLYYEPIYVVEAKVISTRLSELHTEKEAILAGEVAAIVKALSGLATKKESIPILATEAAATAMAFSELEAEKEEEEEGSKGNE